MTWGHWAATGARLGIERALTRLIAAELAVQHGRAAGRLLLRGVAVTAASSGGVALLTVGLAPVAARLLFADDAVAAPLAATVAAISGLALVFTLSGALIGLGRTSMAQALQNLVWPSALLLALAAGIDDPARLILAMGAALLAAALFGGWWIARDRRRFADDETGVRAGPGPGTAALPSLARTAAPLYVVELVQVTIASAPALLLGVFADAAAVSLFSVALRASMLVWVVLISLGAVVSAPFAARHRTADWPALRRLNRRTQLAGGLIGGALCLVFAAAAGPILSLAGSGFAAGAASLVVLAGGQMLNAIYAGQDVLLAMTGHGPVLRRLNLAQLAVLAALSLGLIPRLGALGAALATALVTAQGGLGCAAAVRLLMPGAAPMLAPPLPKGLHRWLRGAPA